MNLTIQRDEHDTVQILEGDKLLFTICEPIGPGDGRMGIFEGDGLNEDDEESNPLRVIRSISRATAERIAIQEAIGLILSQKEF